MYMCLIYIVTVIVNVRNNTIIYSLEQSILSLLIFPYAWVQSTVHYTLRVPDSQYIGVQ